MNRREFLKVLNSLTVLAASGALPGLSLYYPTASAQALDARFFVMIRAATGWDVTLGLDPQVHSNGSDQNDMFIEYRPDEILASGDLRFAPACAPLLPHAEDVIAVNGVFMSDSNVSHDANLDYISTGNSEGRAADLPVAVATASQHGPYGIIFDRNLKRGNSDIVPSSVDNLLSLRTSVNVSRFRGFISGIGTSSNTDMRKAQLSLMTGTKLQNDLLAQLDSLKAELGDGGNGSGDFVLDNARKSGAVAAAAFAVGGAMQACIQLDASLDTHQDHPVKHLQEQTKVWNAVANIFRIFKSVPYQNGTLFDRTTFLVVSEFSRTPYLNVSKGKDHNPLTNSVLLAGAGLKGGRSFGHSQRVLRSEASNGEPRHVGGLVNYTTGEYALTKDLARDPRFQFIFPENIAATVATILGLDRNKFGSISPQVPGLDILLRS